MLRRVGPDHELDFYRGRLFGGGYFLRLVVDSAPPARLVLPKLSNIEIALRSEPGGRSELTVTLTSPDYLELFRALCADLICVDSLHDASKSGTRTIDRGRTHRAVAGNVQGACVEVSCTPVNSLDSSANSWS